MTDHTVIMPRGQKRIGKYLVDGILGEGAMGVVYAGHDPDIDREVAIKTVHKHLIDASGGEDWLVRFAREARAAGRVLHPNLVTIFEYLEQDNVPYLVMERLVSHTLEDRLAAPQGLDVQEVRAIMAQILDGLACIHDAGIVHRDLKPANVMITQTGAVKLTDFGIARITTMDRTGAGMVGTPSYMAPEQFSTGQVDARADIYATGVLLYELVTGRLPFKGGGIEAVLAAGRGQTATPPSEITPGLPPALDAVVLRAMSADITARFASAQDMREAFSAAVESGSAPLDLSAVTRPKRAAAPATMLSRLSAATLSQVERNLISKIGPMGQVIARRAAASATSPDELLESILQEVTHTDERQEMRSSILRLLALNVGSSADGISDADMLRIGDLLRPYLGPITTMLVKRNAATATSVGELVRVLSDTLKNPSEKAAFLKAAARTDTNHKTGDRDA